MSKKFSPSVEQILAHVRPTPTVTSQLNTDEKIEKVAHHMQAIMETLGLDMNNDSIQESPHRIARMYVKELFAGLDPSFFPKITVIENEMKYDQMILIRDIAVMSVCEHHFVTIDGVANVAYIPNHKVIGLSKINRVVDFFSRRPQVQERLTKQIADCLEYILETEHVAVHIDARHYCVVSRGIEDRHSSTSTSDLRGDFKRKPETRNEFLKSISIK